MARIAVIGSEGSGKTILICTLAKRFAAVQPGRPALIAKDRATAMYVERAWSYLQNQEWPPSTRPGELASLTWQIAQDSQRTDLKMLDVAGQDLRQLFSEGRANAIDQLPGELAQIVDYVRNADIFVLLVNLADFLGESNPEKRLGTEWTLRGLLDYVVAEGGNSKHYAAVVFTQVDRFRATLADQGGFDQMAAKLLPNLYSAYLAPKRCARFFVSAIGSTTTEADASGAVRRVPFTDRKTDDSDLKRLMNWIAATSSRVNQQKPNSETFKEESAPNLALPTGSEAEPKSEWNWNRIAGTALLIGAVGVFGKVWFGSGNRPIPSALSVQPNVPELEGSITPVNGITGLLRDTGKAMVSITNRGRAATVFIRVRFVNGDAIVGMYESNFNVPANTTIPISIECELSSGSWKQSHAILEKCQRLSR